ncbi:hypothetical protein [Aminipila luticellarii]|uniref:Uncharacterized protein n=1 Tax=Aminipila luticellarii TaxID=2507160 RepID=A0A410PS34_9FIRM|nr:hypothetical protein [Aminipila luticellarii]QAT41734.1 hypothetical protein EQM06_00025 [Aminipila luticellarii]
MDYKIKLELNIQDIMVFVIEIEPHETAIILYEDTRRSGNLLEDFSFLYPNFYQSEKEWDDFRNLIKATVFVFKKSLLEDEEMKDFLLYIAESMIEYKPEVNPKIEFKLDKTLFEYYCEKDSDYNRFIKYLLSFTENYNGFDASITDSNHLMQKLIL